MQATARRKGVRLAGRVVSLALLALSLFSGSLGSAHWVRHQRPPVSRSRVDRGIASWYEKPQRTASGERYRPNQMTAAHRTLPFGTVVSVRNLKNGKSALVRINDRGPFHKGRVIDLSRAAGRTLGLLSPGLAPVEVRIYALPPS